MQKILKYFSIVLSICTIGYLVMVGKEIRLLKKKNKQYNRFFCNVEQGYQQFTPFFGNLAVPYPLQNLPFGEDIGVVIGVKNIAIRNVVAPHNATIVEHEDGYLLFFRYDLMQTKRPGNYHTHIGCAFLTRDFEQTEEEFRTIDTGSFYSEDPRALTVGDSLYLVFNDIHPSNHNCRTMRIGKLNLEESKLDYVTDLDLQIKPIEKNWVPFEYIENGIAQVYLGYSINPHKVLKVENPQVSALTHLMFPNFSTYNKLFWPSVWGDYVKGGTPAKKVGDLYLSFFHTFFLDENNTAWYNMGAYTFEDTPPFRISAISNYPILYKGIYNTPPINTANPTKKVVFPGGFVEGKLGEKEVFYLVCGENDCAVKLITIDKEVLLKGLKKI
jgi:predicted GH43/DUF377 family glycosyl hydrolase